MKQFERSSYLGQKRCLTIVIGKVIALLGQKFEITLNIRYF